MEIQSGDDIECANLVKKESEVFYENKAKLSDSDLWKRGTYFLLSYF